MASGGGDCNDANPLVNPGKGDEFGDGLDSNCDGVDGFAPPPLPDGRLCTLWGSAGESLYVLWELRDWEKGTSPRICPWSGSLPQFESGVEGHFNSSVRRSHMRGQRGAGERTSRNGPYLQGGSDRRSYGPVWGENNLDGVPLGSREYLLSTAVLDPNQTLSGNPHFAWFHFQLKVDIDEGNPVKAVMTEVEGMSADWQIKQTTTDDGLVVLYP